MVSYSSEHFRRNYKFCLISSELNKKITATDNTGFCTKVYCCRKFLGNPKLFCNLLLTPCKIISQDWKKQKKISFHIQNLLVPNHLNFKYLWRSSDVKNFIIFSRGSRNSKKLFSEERVTRRRTRSVLYSWKRWWITSKFRPRSFRCYDALSATRCHDSQRSRSVIISFTA